jgi:hypothetical protein
MIGGPKPFEKSPTKNDVQTKAYALSGPTCFILPSLRLPNFPLFYLIAAIASMLSGGPAGAAPHERRQARQTRREAACKHLNREFSSILSV